MVAMPGELDERSVGGMTFAPDALVVVLDGITDPQNLGACARSAEAAGAVLLITRKRRAAPLTPAAVRASAGALLHLTVARVANIPRTLERLRDAGVFVAGLDHRAEVDIHRAPTPPRPLALVVGAEDVGLSRLVRETCDALVSIPMRGRTASLNASAALSVGLFAYALRPDHGNGAPHPR
jgi:23S rRNA (guanosine2251-2'-O)-methyltransferase